MAKPYRLANEKLCYIPICKPWRERQRIFLRMVGEYLPCIHLLRTFVALEWIISNNIVHKDRETYKHFLFFYFQNAFYAQVHFTMLRETTPSSMAASPI